MRVLIWIALAILLALPAAACAPPRLQAVREAVARAAAREPPKYD